VIGAAEGATFSKPFDLLLGRRTYDIFAAYWPSKESDPQAGALDALTHQVTITFNKATKYVATHRPESLTWANSQGLGDDVPGRVRDLKGEDGPDLLIQGSSELVHTLMAGGLIDELKLLIYPVVLGKGKRLFDPGLKPGAFKLAKSQASPSGVLIASYERADGVQTGSFG
jgi:dihydrofolate reductase